MKKVNYYLIVAIIVVVWIDFLPYKFPSFIGNGQKIEYLVYNLLLAYIASYIFYYINTLLPHKKNNKIIKRVVNNGVVFIRKDKILNEIKSANVKEGYKIKIKDKVLTVEEFIIKNNKDLHYHLDTILVIQDRLPTQLLNITLLLKNHPYFKINYKNVDNIDKYIDDYILLSKKLSDEFRKL